MMYAAQRRGDKAGYRGTGHMPVFKVSGFQGFQGFKVFKFSRFQVLNRISHCKVQYDVCRTRRDDGEECMQGAGHTRYLGFDVSRFG